MALTPAQARALGLALNVHFTTLQAKALLDVFSIMAASGDGTSNLVAQLQEDLEDLGDRVSALESSGGGGVQVPPSGESSP